MKRIFWGISFAALLAAPAFGQEPQADPCSRVSFEFSVRRAYFAENRHQAERYGAVLQGTGEPWLKWQAYPNWFAAVEQAVIDGRAMVALRLSAPQCFSDFPSLSEFQEKVTTLESQFATANETVKQRGFQ